MHNRPRPFIANNWGGENTAGDKPATMSVLHNGVKIHENVELKKHTTSAPDNGADDTPGPLHLQDHGNPVAYRNVWLIELK